MLLSADSAVRDESEETTMEMVSNSVLLFSFFVFQIFMIENTAERGSRIVALSQNRINLLLQ